MAQESKGLSQVALLVGGAALGAVAMYLMDPEQGNRRRALAKDKVNSAGNKARQSFDATSRDLTNRAQGLKAEASRLLSRKNTVGDTEIPSTPL